MITVTQAEFHRAVGKKDLIPNVREHETLWKFRDGRLFGVSKPGYKEPGAPKEYQVEPRYLPGAAS